MINPTDMAVLSVMGHGGCQGLLDAGFRWEWMEQGDAQIVAKEAMTLHIQGRPVNIANVMLRLSIQDWQPILKAWTDGYGSTAAEAAAKVRGEFVRRELLGKWMVETTRLAHTSTDVMQWFPKQLEVAQSLVRTGAIYSPKPTAHAAKPIPKVHKAFAIPTMNELFRGGVWKPGFFGIASLPMGGKTTMAITIASECARLGIRNVIVSSEMPEQYYVYRVMRTFGFSKEEFDAYSQGDDGTVRSRLFHEYLGTLDTSLSVYGAEYMEADKIGSIMEIERPDVLQIDHLLAIRIKSRRQNDSMAAGELAYALQDFTNRYLCMTVVYGQLSDENATAFAKNHDLPFVKFFGSSVPNQAFRWAALTCRHWDWPNVQYFRVKKNSLDESGEVDTEHFFRYDRASASYTEREGISGQ